MYNARDVIEETMDSVCAQTVSDWELLLVDDCSTDDSVQVIRAYMDRRQDARIRLLQLNAANGGSAARARNKGLSEAQGRYIAFLDADDLWTPDKLEKTLAYMEGTGASFVFTAYEFGDASAKGTGRIVHVPESLTYQKALSRTVIFTSTVLVDTKKIDKALLKMPEIASEDTATWWQILKSGVTAKGLDRVLTIYRRQQGTLSADKLTAVKRIWALYRRQEGLSFFMSVRCFAGWAVRATLRRL